MTKHTEIQEYEVKDQWLTQNGRDITLLYGAGCENEIERVLKILNNHAKLVEALKLTVEITRIARKYFPKSIQNSDRFTLENTCAAINKALSELDKDGE
jgi:hypothetical protein